MTDAVPSDAVSTVRATLARAGRTDRPKVTVPDEDRDRFPADETVRLLLGGSQYHARVERAIDDSIELRSVRDNPRMARDNEGEDRLREWADDVRLDFGRTVHVDVLDEGFCYGLRAPGETAVYDVPERQNDGLASIAEDVAAGAGSTESAEDVAAGAGSTESAADEEAEGR